MTTSIKLTHSQLVLWVVENEAHRAEETHARSLKHLQEVIDGESMPNPQFIRALPGDIVGHELWQRTLHYVETGSDDDGLLPSDACPATDDPVRALRSLIDRIDAPVTAEGEIRPIALEFQSSQIEAYEQWARRCREVLSVADPDAP